jgi:tripartite-type tricarboxylate transporter receptor subunit TctC
MNKLRLLLAALLVPAAALVAPDKTSAQEFPSRPITLVVPYAAGGGNDAMARTVAEKMSRTLGQQVVVENRAGAGGSTATRAVARSAPDGYTLVIGGTGTLAVNPTLYQNVGYDPRKDFAPVGLIGTSALVVTVDPKLPVHSIRELIDLAKKEPKKLNYASAGVGSGIHLGTVLFELMAGIELTHIPYRGAPEPLIQWRVDLPAPPPVLGLHAKARCGVGGDHASVVCNPRSPTAAEAALG